MLKDHGYKTIPVNPTEVEIHGLKSIKNLENINESVNTLTMYVNAKISSGLKESIINLSPQRVIFNPGTENEGLETVLKQNNIKIIHACTLVMLRTGQFQES
jgi:predicted CoA-binding protein